MDEEIFEEAVGGNVDGVRRLVEGHGVDPNAAVGEGGGRTPLIHCASRGGQLNVVRYLVEEARVNVEMTNFYGFTALHFACAEHHLTVARYLVETGGANIEARSRGGDTALHIASRAGFIDVVQYLVEQRHANTDAKNGGGRTPLENIFWFRLSKLSKKTKETFRYLLPRTSRITRTTLMDAWRHENLDDIGVTVLEKYASAQSARMRQAFRRNPIHTLLLQFPLPTAKIFQDYIMIYPSSVLSLLDDEGRLPIHVALTSRIIVWRIPQIIRFLFQREPRSALARDPTTGLYPHETAPCMLSEDTDDDDDDDSDVIDDDRDCHFWLDEICLDLVYILFRSNPQHLLQSRAQSGKAHSLSAQNGERQQKRAKTMKGAVN